MDVEIRNSVIFLLVILVSEVAAVTNDTDATDAIVDIESNQAAIINGNTGDIETLPVEGNGSNGSPNIGIIIPEETNSNTCGGQFFGQTGEIRSPNYPDLYPVNIRCEWKIFAREGYTIKLTFDAFKVESSTNCVHDRVVIADDQDLIAVLCGASTLAPLHSRTNTLTIVLYSDDVVTFSGFLAYFVIIASDSTIQKTTTSSVSMDTGAVSSETLTIMLVLIGVILLGVISLIAGIIFYKMTKDNVKNLQKKKKRSRKKRATVNHQLPPPIPAPNAYIVNHPSLIDTFNYQTRPDETKIDMT